MNNYPLEIFFRVQKNTRASQVVPSFAATSIDSPCRIMMCRLWTVRASSSGAATTTLRRRFIAIGTATTTAAALGYAHQHSQCREWFPFQKKELSATEWMSSLKSKQEHPAHSALDEGKVVVELDDEKALPTMTLEEIDREVSEEGGRLLATYEGVVYDVTEFANAHPGGRELLLTAVGLDLSHFFANYTVHGNSEKAANWLAPLAVGKLSDEEAALSVARTTPQLHASRRMSLLKKSRRKLLGVVAALPAYIAARAVIRFVGRWMSSSVARWLSSWIPSISVPGYSKGSEPMVARKDGESPRGRVAVVGGGIAGCGAAWMLARDGFEVHLYEARPNLSGNARTFDWTGFADGLARKSCVSVTAWPPLLYKNYEALLKEFEVETMPMPLSWFLNSKVPGYEGTLWGADPRCDDEKNTLRRVFADDFAKYQRAEKLVGKVTAFFTGRAWAPWRRGDEPSMYDNHTGLGLLNPFNVIPLYKVCRWYGVSDVWWDVVFTPYYTASFLVDELRPFPAVFGPIIEQQIPLNPTPENSWHGESPNKGPDHCKLTTCVTWKDAGDGIRSVFAKLVRGLDSVNLNTRVLSVELLKDGTKRVVDEHDNVRIVDRVVFACPCNAIGNMIENIPNNSLENVVLNSPEYADDHHPDSGHMHAVMHSDASVIDEKYRSEFLNRGSNYVEVTRLSDGKINIENQYNFGVQTPGHGVYDMPLDKKPVMLISHALGEGKSIDKALVRGGGNHARAHPLYSPWNVASQISLRLCQGRNGLYYASNWTTPGNCHDMSLLSGFLCAHAIGAEYPFPEHKDAEKDFHRLNDLMGVF